MNATNATEALTTIDKIAAIALAGAAAAPDLTGEQLAPLLREIRDLSEEARASLEQASPGDAAWEGMAEQLMEAMTSCDLTPERLRADWEEGAGALVDADPRLSLWIYSPEGTMSRSAASALAMIEQEEG